MITDFEVLTSSYIVGPKGKVRFIKLFIEWAFYLSHKERI